MREGAFTGLFHDTSLFESLFRESQNRQCPVRLAGLPYHNHHINIYDHSKDDEQDKPRDILLHTLSRLYIFKNIKDEIVGNIEQSTNESSSDISECAVYLDNPSFDVQRNLLRIFQRISEQAAITDLCISDLKCDEQANDEVFNISSQAVSVTLRNCTSPSHMIDHTVYQLSDCNMLNTLDLNFTNLTDVTSLTISNKACLTRLDLGGSKMSADLSKSFCMQLTHPTHLEYLNLSGNPQIGPFGHHITEAIETWGTDSPLKMLDISGCGDVVSQPLLSAVSTNCTNISCLLLSQNNLRKLSEFVP